jgi:hypothetical protein
MNKPLTILQLTDIINHCQRMFGPDSFYPRKPAIENLREYAARFDASEPPAEGFHRALWIAVRDEVNRLLSTYAK